MADMSMAGLVELHITNTGAKILDRAGTTPWLAGAQVGSTIRVDGRQCKVNKIEDGGHGLVRVYLHDLEFSS